MQNKPKRPGEKAELPRTEAAVKAYTETGIETDPLGMWTGRPRLAKANGLHPEPIERPVQDADDL